MTNQQIEAINEINELFTIKEETTTDEQVLNAIKNLDEIHNSDNYLEIYHLRNALNWMSREELDAHLYSLQAQGLLTMACLVKAADYTIEQYDAGIPQNDIVGPLFFLEVN